MLACFSLTVPAAVCVLAAQPASTRALISSRRTSVVMLEQKIANLEGRIQALEQDLLSDPSIYSGDAAYVEEVNWGRRAILPAIAFGVGAVVTGGSKGLPGSETYSEMSRLAIVDRGAEAATAKFFPGALGSLTMDRLCAQTLAARGYNKDNTLFASSICPDEINVKPGEMIDLMKTRWGENFALGGLAGLPFSGKAGFSAYAHHVPEQGKSFIVFAPHVGVDAGGTVGKIKRDNQGSASTACGAAVGAYKGIMASKGEIIKSSDPDYDAQIGFIVEKLGKPVSDKVELAPDAITFVTYQMYILAREYFVTQLLNAGGFWDDATEVTVLGGIQINRAVGGDRFMPLMMQSRQQKEGTVVDLYETTFGRAPDLSDALGGTISNEEIFNYPLGK